MAECPVMQCNIEPYVVYKLVHQYKGNKISQKDNNILVAVKGITDKYILLQRIDKQKFTLRGKYVCLLKLKFGHSTYGRYWGLFETEVENENLVYKEVVKPILTSIPISKLKQEETYNLRDFSTEGAYLHRNETKIRINSKYINDYDTFFPISSEYVINNKHLPGRRNTLNKDVLGIDYFIRYSL